MQRFVQLLSLFTIMALLNTAQAANLKDAFERYDAGQHEAAYEQFDALLAIASPVAALQMAFMTLDEEGTDYNPARAFALASLAKQWGHADAQAVADQIQPHLSPEQLQQAEGYRDAVEERRLVFNFERRTVNITPLRESRLEVLERRKVPFPGSVMRRHRIGWYHAIFLVSSEGRVMLVDDASAPITRDFRGPAHHEIKGWRYHPMEDAEYTTVLMDYFVSDSGTIPAYLTNVHQAWEPANENSAEFQFLLGQLLLRLESYTKSETSSNSKYIEFTDTLQASEPPTERSYLTSDETLTLPMRWSGLYWLHMAARNGHRDAQWNLAIYHEEWMRYLVSQGDIQAKTWHGAELASRAINDEDREYGLQLLREARDSGDKTAIEVASHFL